MNQDNVQGNANEMRTNTISTRVLWFAGALLTTLLTLMSVNQALAGKIYKCVDEQTKKVTMSDSACQYNAAKTAAPADKAAADKGVTDKAAADKAAADKAAADKANASKIAADKAALEKLAADQAAARKAAEDKAAQGTVKK